MLKPLKVLICMREVCLIAQNTMHSAQHYIIATLGYNNGSIYGDVLASGGSRKLG